MKPYWRLVRPKQWTKNLLVFAAPLFAGAWADPESIVRALLAFAAMCAVSSATYIANDIADRDRDRAHPVKKKRPLASGAASLPAAIALAAVLLAAGFATGLYLGPWVVAVLAGYIALQAVYNLWVKHVAIADVFFIATGFVLRAALGAEAVVVPISGWLLFCTAALALMLGFAKRRNEFIIQGDERTGSRESLADYTRPALDIFVAVFAGVSAMSYGIYALESSTARAYPGLLLTVPFVLYGVCRYLLLVFAKGLGGEPEEVLLKDRHVQFAVLAFVLAAAFAVKGAVVPIVD